MDFINVYLILKRETPGFFNGFVVNIMISVLSMFFGTLAGVLTGRLRHGKALVVRAGGNFVTSIFRNTPSFILMFYLAYIIPVEFAYGNQVIRIAPWIKATLALAFPVIGFVSDQTFSHLEKIKNGEKTYPSMLILSWLQFFIIILMASSTASVIGAEDIVSTANALIATYQEPNMIYVIYGYVALWFMVAGLSIHFGVDFLVKRRLPAPSLPDVPDAGPGDAGVSQT